MIHRFSTFIAVLFTQIIAFGQFSYTFLDANNINTSVTNGGTFFTNISQSAPSFEFPAGSSNHLIYASSFWFGGEDINGQLKLSGQMYTLGQDLYPGILADNGTADPANDPEFEFIFQITQAEIDYHLANVFTPGYVPSAVITDWPAHGDVAMDQDFYMAPFVDVNANGIYDPMNGDYPMIRGDVATYVFMHDKGIHAESGGEPIGLECHMMFYQYTTSDDLNNTVFVNFHLINRSTQTLFDFRTGCFVDPDIGESTDDFIGCDSVQHMMYAYNASNTDADYGSDPPTVGVLSLDQDMDVFGHFATGSGATGTPSVASDFYQYLSGYYKDGSPITYGGSGYGGATPTTHIYTGNPNDIGSWSEYQNGNPGGDRRMYMSTSPITLTPGLEICYDFAFVAAEGGDNLQNVNNLMTAASNVQTFFDNQTDFLCEYYDQTLDISDEVNELTPTIFPNPVDDVLNISLSGTYDVEIYAPDGRLVMESRAVSGDQALSIDLAAGNYVLKVRQNKAVHNQVLIVR